MALAKKGSQVIISVDGRQYRWSVRRKPATTQAEAWAPVVIAVEPVRNPKASLVVDLPTSHTSNRMGSPAGSVTPAEVARYIRTAVAAGWDPQAEGEPFHYSQNFPDEEVQ